MLFLALLVGDVSTSQRAMTRSLPFTVALRRSLSPLPPTPIPARAN